LCKDICTNTFGVYIKDLRQVNIDVHFMFDPYIIAIYGSIITILKKFKNQDNNNHKLWSQWDENMYLKIEKFSFEIHNKCKQNTPHLLSYQFFGIMHFIHSNLSTFIYCKNMHLYYKNKNNCHHTQNEELSLDCVDVMWPPVIDKHTRV